MLIVHGITAQDLPKFTITLSENARDGYYFFSPVKVRPSGNSAPINILLDGKGKYVYYKQFGKKGPFAGGFRLHPNGMASYYYNEKFFLMKDNFELVDSITCANGVAMDSHELLILPGNRYALIGVEHVQMDLSKYKYFSKGTAYGSTQAKVRCNLIQELNENKSLVFEWHGKDHYSIEDMDTVYMNDSANVDWMHANAIEVDNDGNYMISMRNMNEVTKISRKDGQIIWRLGGKKNQFAFSSDSCWFYGQHDIRRTAEGTITLFDNGKPGNNIKPEGAKEFRLDEKNLRADLVKFYINDPKVYSLGYGSVQKADDGYLVINYGRSELANIIFNVLDPNGKKVFELSTPDTMINYRTYYYPELPFKINRPKVSAAYKDGTLFLEAENGHATYEWTNGLKTKAIKIDSPGEYQVFVPSGNDGYMASEPFVVTDENLKKQKPN